MGYLTYGSAVTPKDILLSPYRLWSDTGMLDIKTQLAKHYGPAVFPFNGRLNNMGMFARKTSPCCI